MKFNKNHKIVQYHFSSRTVLFLCIIAFCLFSGELNSLQRAVSAQENNSTLKIPDGGEFEGNLPSTVEIKKIPSFPDVLKDKSTAHRISASTGVVPIDTRLRLYIESPIDAKVSMIGDYFKAHVLEDFYIPITPPQLIVPKGSWVRGRISFLKRPNILSMAGKIGLHLYEIVTPVGEVAPLDAELDVQKGVVNAQGLLDPMTNFGTKALQPTQALLNTDQGKAISALTLGVPVIGTLVEGTLTALFSEGDNIVLNRGQELQVLLKAGLQLPVN